MNITSHVSPARRRASGRQILVVDDNHDAADSLAQLMGAMGAEVAVAYGGQEALTSMSSACPTIAFIDISMPVMNGYELAARIRRSDTFEGVILIALTGWDQTAEWDSHLPTGFDDHLTKPADVGALSRLLKYLV